MSEYLQKNILSTIIYYDVMDYPLTAFEIWKYLISDQGSGSNEQETKNNICSLAEAVYELEGEEMKKNVEEYQGFYFLHGRQFLVGQRLTRNKISESKYKIILKAVKFLKFIPYIRMIAVSGRVAMKNAKKKSDLDLLIVFEKDHIFTGRFLSFMLLSVLGIRRKGNKIKNRICSNHFLSTDFSVSIKDLFSSHEYAFALPAFGFKYYQKFLEKNNWIKEYRTNFENELPSLKEEKDSRLSEITRKILENIFSFKQIEIVLRKIQIAKIKSNPKTQKIGGIIIYNNDEMAFWPDFEKQGLAIYSKFKDRLNKLGIE